MIIVNGVIFIWSGTNATIPTGWSRVTGLDGIFPKGTANATNPNETGGTTTHTHTVSGTHTHTAAAHTHTISLSSTTSTGTAEGGTGMPAIHNHADFTSGAVASFTCDSPSTSYGSVSNNPSYHDVIYITPAANTSFLPTGVIALADAAAPRGYAICNGGGSTPNLTNKYLKGAAGGGNAGGTGGSTTNTHALSHTHTTSHQHASATSAGPSNANIAMGGSGTQATYNHTHAVALPAPATNNVSTDNVSIETAETVEPTYTKLLAIQAVGNAYIAKDMIALWLGTLASIPTNWILCDGNGGTVDMRGRHLKITATVDDVGDTGGSNTHTHAAQGHTHTITASTHTATVSHVSGGETVHASGGTTKGETNHTATTNAISLVLASADTEAESSSNEPAYRTVAFIKSTRGRTSANFLFNFM